MSIKVTHGLDNSINRPFTAGNTVNDVVTPAVKQLLGIGENVEVYVNDMQASGSQELFDNDVVSFRAKAGNKGMGVKVTHGLDNSIDRPLSDGDTVATVVTAAVKQLLGIGENVEVYVNDLQASMSQTIYDGDVISFRAKAGSKGL